MTATTTLHEATFKGAAPPATWSSSAPLTLLYEEPMQRLVLDKSEPRSIFTPYTYYLLRSFSNSGYGSGYHDLWLYMSPHPLEVSRRVAAAPLPHVRGSTASVCLLRNTGTVEDVIQNFWLSDFTYYLGDATYRRGSYIKALSTLAKWERLTPERILDPKLWEKSYVREL